MVITREEIEKRLEQLKIEQAQVQNNLTQLQANLNAYLGAIQDCEHWLKVLDADAPVSEADTHSGASEEVPTGA
jgi:hypothetical protein